MEITKKRTQRINAMKILYNMDLMKNPIDIAANHVFEDTIEDEEVIRLVNDIILKEQQIKDIVSKSLTDYSINRLSYVDRAIIMLATYEMLMGLPPTIAINEALEITKEFSNLDDNKAKAFNNRLLDTIAKYI